MIYVVVPVHNNWSCTRYCLQQLRQQKSCKIFPVVVDDGSTDGTRENLRLEFPDVLVLEGNGQLWWTGAMVLATRFVLERAQPGDYLLSLNNDTIFDADLVSTLRSVSAAAGAAIVAATCVSSLDGRGLDVGGRFDWADCQRTYSTDLFNQMPEGQKNIEDLEFLTSRAVLYPIEVFHTTGTFNAEALPHYHSDMEFTQRAKRLGFRLVVTREAQVTVVETPETSGAHFSPNAYLSMREAWLVLTSPRSSLYPPPMFRYIELCCPPQHQVRNKISYFLAGVSRSYGRTRLGAAILGVLHATMKLVGARRE